MIFLIVIKKHKIKILKKIQDGEKLFGLEKNFKKLDLEELHMIKDTLNKEIDNKFKLFGRGEKLHKAVLKREARKRGE